MQKRIEGIAKALSLTLGLLSCDTSPTDTQMRCMRALNTLEHPASYAVGLATGQCVTRQPVMSTDARAVHALVQKLIFSARADPHRYCP
uniref:Lipoprotein n=1 Tax=Pseudomonas fluorescens (strain SBW25) TaxID=216595 RepID=A0A0G4E562_PSEFS|nr:hypothetical protein PQBR57_0134 [Pseudomonas fluorescens SBW25]